MKTKKQSYDYKSKIAVILGIFVLGFILGKIPVATEKSSSLVTTYPSPTPSIVSGWIAYVLPEEKIKMQYPPTWKLEEDSSQSSYILMSPNDFRLTFRVNLDGLGGGCSGECPEHNIENEVIDTLSFYDVPLYLVVNGAKDNFFRGIKPFIRFNVIPRRNCYFNICYGFNGKNTPGATIISGSFETFMPTEQFIQSSDVQTAVNILKTLSY